MNKFEVKVEGNGEKETSKTREAFKDAFNAPASILKLNDYGIFLNVEDKGLVAGKYINKIQDSRIKLPQFKGLKSNGLPPTILYDYKKEEDSELDKFVERYYTEIKVKVKEGEKSYYIFKPELKYYKSTFEEFDGDEFVKEFDEDEFVKKLDEYFTKIHFEAKRENWNNFFTFVNNESDRLGLTDTYMEHINKIRDCITKTKPKKSKPVINESFEEAIERTGCSASVSDLGTSNMDLTDYAYDWLAWAVGYESSGKEVGLKIINNLFNDYKYSLSKEEGMGFEYLQNLKIKGVTNIEKNINGTTYKFNTIGEIIKLPDNPLFNSLKEHISPSIFSITNQLDVNIKLEEDNKIDVELYFNTDEMRKNY